MNQTTSEGNFLQISASVAALLTSDDPELPRSMTIDEQGGPRFAKYAPFESFVNKVENYPYPFIVGGKIWEFPNTVPDDWQGQNLNQPNNPITVTDHQLAIDATVLKQGVANLVFHPHGWIRNSQMVEIVEHVVQEHGDRVKFLNFRECLERVNRNLLADQPVRAANGQDNGVRLLDLNNDGFLDVVIGNDNVRKTRIWKPDESRWRESDFQVSIVHVDQDGNHRSAGVRFFITQANGQASFLVRNEREAGVWHFQDQVWKRDDAMLAGLEMDGQPIWTARDSKDQGVRLRDLNDDGRCELIVGGSTTAVFHWDDNGKAWRRLPFDLPAETSIVDQQGEDAGLRFVDVDGDGRDDVIFSDARRYSLHLFSSMEEGWNRQVRSAVRPSDDVIPPIVRADGNTGAWFAEDHLWIQNEDTHRLPAGVDRRSFVELLGDEATIPRSADASLRTIEVADGYRVELVAAEPLVMDPVGFDWGADGRLWVVEMADYPLGLDDKGKPGGRVRFLEDLDGDGRYDRSTLFAEGLPFPSDIMVWRDGILVTAAPNILYLEDRNGDGKSDHQVVLFSGFVEGNQQHRVNGLRWGLDNWVYVPNGDSGGVIRSAKTNDEVNINGRDLRIEPDSGRIETTTGRTQHGRGRDDWGNWWGANNSNPMFQFVLDDHYLSRNPHVAPPDARHMVSTLDNSPIHPISKVLSHWSGYRPPAPGQPSRFTSACGTMLYRDHLLGDDLYGNMFVSEPVHNLVHRRLIEWDGLLMRSRKPANEENSEFLRSRDSWFRPTTVRTGPDGCLWIADMYRLVIEHPEWIADDVEASLDLRAGRDRGRIYRIVSDATPPREVADISALDVDDLVRMLRSPNGTLRDIVHKELLWRGDRDEKTSALQSAVTTSDNPLQRLHALCVLDGLGSISSTALAAAMQDSHPGVRRHAARISERFADTSAADEWMRVLIERSRTETDPHVRLQIAYSLGAFDNAEAARTLGTMLVRHASDRYLSAAVISGIANRTADVASGARSAIESLKAARDGNAEVKPSAEVLHNETEWIHIAEPIVRTALAIDDLATVRIVVMDLLLEASENASTPRMSTMADMQALLRKHGSSLAKLLDDETSMQRYESLRAEAMRTLLDSEQSSDRRTASLRFLAGDARFKLNEPEMLTSLLLPQTPSDLQQAAIRAVGDLQDRNVLKSVLDRWQSFDPLTRDRLVAVVLQRIDSTRVLLALMESQTIDASDLTAVDRQRLFNHPDAAIAKEAAKWITMRPDDARQAVIDRYLPATRSGGDRDRGRLHFQKACAACHKIGDIGFEVGPSLVGLIDKSPEFLTTHILDPSRAIEDKYLNYSVLTIDGRQLTGLLQSETATSVTLAGQNGETHTILKRDIETDGFVRGKLSMMPQGLEGTLDPRALADVIAFIIDNQPLPKSFPGNQPQVVSIDKQTGAIRLPATAAEIYGDTLVFESKYENLGYWGSANDRAVWQVDIPVGGRYDIYMNAAVAEGTEDNPFVFRIGDQSLVERTQATSTWDDYRRRKIGTLDLRPGRQQAVLQSDKKPNRFLMDLLEILIIPQGE
ncbi:MAG: HEAT repeat domain-containing protein [Pirellulaceae bacterium]